jgi:hypothetical protein
MLDGAPDAVKVACPVLAGGKAGDNIKGLPIGTLCVYPQRKGHFEAGKYHYRQHQRRRGEIRGGFLGECDLFAGGKKSAHSMIYQNQSVN